MKTKILIAVALFISFIATAAILPERKAPKVLIPGAGKPDPVFNYIRSHRQGKGITTMWSSNASSSVVSCFTLIRTYEDPTDPFAEWTPVSVTACNSGRAYRSTDENVSPGFVSYRIVATLIGGGYAYSDVETVRIVQH